MTSALPPTSTAPSSVPLLANIGPSPSVDEGSVPNSVTAAGGTNEGHHPPPPPPSTAPFSSLELLATLLASNRTANMATSAGPSGCAAVPPPTLPSQSSPGSFPLHSANQTSPFASSAELTVIQQLLRATNPLLSNNNSNNNNNAFLGEIMAPSALQALLMAGMAQQQQQRRMAALKREMETADEMTQQLNDGNGTPLQSDKMEASEDQLLNQRDDALFIKTELGCGEHQLQQLAEEEEGGETKPNAQQHNTQGGHQRRQRVGGSSVKTAEVWRFFTQVPPPDQAATCQICQKTIKATNSSTTGMIRHLRSCHQTEFQQLQQARFLKNLKNDAAERQKVLLQFKIGIDPHSDASIDAIQAALQSSFTAFQSPPPTASGGIAAKHSVETLISGELRSLSPNSTAQQRQLLEQIENFKTSRPTSMERSKKEGGGGTDPTMVVVGKRAADEGTAGADESTNVPMSSPKGAPLLSTATKRRKGMIAAGVGEEFCLHGALSSSPPGPGGSLAGGDCQTPKTGGKKGVNGRKTTSAASPAAVMPPPSSANGGEPLAAGGGGAKLIAQQQNERISDQIAAMMLVDQTDFLLDRIGFRQFVQSLVPGYSMPSGDQFRAQIIPRVAKQLHQLALFRDELQRNNPFGLPPAFGMLLHNNIKSSMHSHHLHHHHQQHLFPGGSPTALSTSSSSSSGTPSSSGLVISNNHHQTMTSLISPSSSTEESGFHDEEQQHNNTSSSAFGSSSLNGSNGGNANGVVGLGLEELVQQAAFHSQNISRSFTFSIDLNSDGSNENAGEKASGKEEDSDTTSSI